MKAEQLSPRLEQVAQYIQTFGQQPIRLADIGSDHAYLPVHLVLKQQIDFAIAGEVVEGPFQSAQREVQAHSLEATIDVRKGDGLEVVYPQDAINTFSICGMGGNLIRDILKQGLDKIQMNAILVLQPNTSEQNLRSFLNKYHFDILAETVLIDQGRLYEVMVSQKVEETPLLTEEELMFGPFNLRQQTPEFSTKWQRERHNIQRILASVKQSKHVDGQKQAELEHKINLIKEVLADDNSIKANN
ncbi:tRNA (adenine(22)-N(1))-methyltransferase [Fundicoccus culcitae]|uniref:tRNA (Adenine(22)-N(1))-methyltransferase TrmK n=1 Tax=Fundicoccus culcitae TaxID=2969821 RepID=A0ABY5P705_9LACT|nr:tRNA (adenine(22)-N(1))-methyltransferase TrmK [Fundicoccus culcitae]UUX34522.1 tRNA (adenine(22)-N(1))-methyltransferase TrmK [Fundicoccus culcitae]